jgi:hypothetical protein
MMFSDIEGEAIQILEMLVAAGRREVIASRLRQNATAGDVRRVLAAKAAATVKPAAAGSRPAPRARGGD